MPTHNFPQGTTAKDHSFWWKCRFKVVWPDAEEVDWAVDLLLAHAVVLPVLSQYAKDIPYWRFHRRAARDSAGHQFTFLFYGAPELASSIFEAIDESEVLKNTLNANLVTEAVMDNPNQPRLPDIGDASDPNWSPELQNNWPSFIMGVSSLWLGLIIEDMQDSPRTYKDIHQLLEKYREVNARITDKWRYEGQHALLHHLNAIFGYQPMLFRKELEF
ncbi:hypothetical protein [Methylomonas sp. MgM2]